MSQVRVECPNCDAAFKAPAKAIGRRAKCPKCHEFFTLREASDVYAIAPASGEGDIAGLAEGIAVGQQPAATDRAAAGATSDAPGAVVTFDVPALPAGTRAIPAEPQQSTERADKLVGLAIAAGVFATGSTTLASLAGWHGITCWGLIDAGLLGALTYGVYRRSRVCAVLLLVLWIVEKGIMFLEPQVPAQRWAAVMGLFLFGGAFLMGIWGTFLHHKIYRRQLASSEAGVFRGTAGPAHGVVQQAAPWQGEVGGGTTYAPEPGCFANFCGTLSEMLPWTLVRWTVGAVTLVFLVVYTLLYVQSYCQAEQLASLDRRIPVLRMELEALQRSIPPVTWGPMGPTGEGARLEHMVLVQRAESALNFALDEQKRLTREHVPRTTRPLIAGGAVMLGLWVVPAVLGPILRRRIFHQ